MKAEAEERSSIPDEDLIDADAKPILCPVLFPCALIAHYLPMAFQEH